MQNKFLKPFALMTILAGSTASYAMIPETPEGAGAHSGRQSRTDTPRAAAVSSHKRAPHSPAPEKQETSQEEQRISALVKNETDAPIEAILQGTFVPHAGGPSSFHDTSVTIGAGAEHAFTLHEHDGKLLHTGFAVKDAPYCTKDDFTGGTVVVTKHPGSGNLICKFNAD